MREGNSKRHHLTLPSRGGSVKASLRAQSPTVKTSFHVWTTGVAPGSPNVTVVPPGSPGITGVGPANPTSLV